MEPLRNAPRRVQLGLSEFCHDILWHTNRKCGFLDSSGNEIFEHSSFRALVMEFSHGTPIAKQNIGVLATEYA